MENRCIASRNSVLYCLRYACYNSAMPVMWGSIAQLFLAARGLSSTDIGCYATLISAAQMILYVIFANLGDRSRNPLKLSIWLYLANLAVTTLYIPISLTSLDGLFLLGLMGLLTVGQTACYCGMMSCDFNITYMILPNDMYGKHLSYLALTNGIVVVGFSTVYSRLIDANAMGNPYLICMILGCALLGISAFLGTRMKVLYPHEPSPVRADPIRQLRVLMKDRLFRILLVPNFLRGFAQALIGSITVVALSMGIGQTGASKISIVVGLGSVGYTLLYRLLAKKLKIGAIGLVGCGLMWAAVFFPRENATLFLILYFLVDAGYKMSFNAMAITTYEMIDPAVVGSFNVWRTVIISAGATVLTPLVPHLLENVSPLWLFIPCALAQTVSMLWYQAVQKRMG